MTHSQLNRSLDDYCCCDRELHGVHSLLGIDDLGDIRCRLCGGRVPENRPAEEREEEKYDPVEVEALARGWSPQLIRWWNTPRPLWQVLPELFDPPRRRRRTQGHRRKTRMRR